MEKHDRTKQPSCRFPTFREWEPHVASQAFPNHQACLLGNIFFFFVERYPTDDATSKRSCCNNLLIRPICPTDVHLLSTMKSFCTRDQEGCFFFLLLQLVITDALKNM